MERCCDVVEKDSSLGFWIATEALLPFLLKHMDDIPPVTISALPVSVMECILLDSDGSIAEENLFLLFLQWFECHKNELNDEVLGFLLKLFRFPLMMADFLVTQVETSAIISCSVAELLLFEAYRYHCSHSGKFRKIYRTSVELADTRMQERGPGIIIFGENAGEIISASPGTNSFAPVSCIRGKDNSCFSFGNYDGGSIEIKFSGCYRLLSMRICTRYCYRFSFKIKRQHGDEWTNVLGDAWSCDVNDIKPDIEEISFSKREGFDTDHVTGRFVQLSISGLSARLWYPGVNWLEIIGKAAYDPNK